MRNKDEDRPGRRLVTPRMGVLVFVLSVLALRVLYLIWLSPYEIVADEGQYWDWSRRLEASYYSKGPGIAWLIAASTALFGIHPWSVRLPAAVASTVAGLSLGCLAIDSFTGDSPQPRVARRLGVLTALLFCAAPAFGLSAILMTVDSPYVACWTLAAWAGWRIMKDREQRDHPLTPWLALAFALGVGFLFKYTIALLIPGLLAFAWLRRRQLRWDREAALHAMLASAILITVVSPVWVWNSRHGWAGLGHLLGFLDPPGGDRAVVSPHDRLKWPVIYLLSQAGIFGPVLALIGMGVGQCLSGTSSARRADAGLFMLCCAAPTLLFFLAVSLRTSIEGNWPIAAVTTLLIPAAHLVVAGNPGGGRDRPTSGMRPLVWRWWLASVIFNLAAVVLIHAPTLAARLPVVGRYVPEHRFTGFAARARRASAAIEQIRHAGQEPIVIALTHNDAGRLAFYLPDHPVVFSAGSYVGDRQSSYDFFVDTNLALPALRGRCAFLFGGNQQVWQTAFAFDALQPISEGDPGFIGLGYRGPRRERQPSAPGRLTTGGQ